MNQCGKRRALLVAIVLIFTGSWSVTGSSQLVAHDLMTYYGYTGDVRSIGWTQDAITERVELEIEHFETGVIETFEREQSPLLWTPQRVGHYVVRARACNDAGCSVTVSSTDSGWWLFFWIQPPQF